MDFGLSGDVAFDVAVPLGDVPSVLDCIVAVVRGQNCQVLVPFGQFPCLLLLFVGVLDFEVLCDFQKRLC